MTKLNPKTRVLVVDDEEVVTWGLRTLLVRHPWVERCLQATDGPTAVALARRYEPHVALVDVSLWHQPDMDLCPRLHEASPVVKVLLMSSGSSVARRTIESAGAIGFVSKRWTVDDIVATIRVAALGVNVTTQPRITAPALTSREEQVLAGIAQGSTDAEIADSLYLSVYTVKQHARAVYRKLNARNRTDAVQRAQRLGVLL